MLKQTVGRAHIIIAGLIAGIIIQAHGQPQQENMQDWSAPVFEDGRYYNPDRVDSIRPGGIREMIKERLFGSDDRSPEQPPPVQRISRGYFDGTPAEGLRITWLGHSSLVIEIEGRIILVDPMLSLRASPIPLVGPTRFNKTLPLEPKELPEIDIVLISHNHYDHLDRKTIKTIRDRVKRFHVPMGVESLLEDWGVEPGKISAHTWWETIRHDSSLTLVATPAQHSSARWLTDRNRTLWVSWTIIGRSHRLFYSGDTGYFSGLKTIGERYGPFDVTMLEIAAYSKYWPEVHMQPEMTIRAHLDLCGKLLLPVHWGCFDLSFHHWTEPIERALAAAEKNDVRITTPIPGESVVPGENISAEKWWR